jgi:hypothetical protein
MTDRSMARLAVTLGSLLLSLLPTLAHAESDAGARARADALFDSARELMGKSLFGEACPRLAEAMALTPNGRVELALALCHEGEGKLATALAEFRDARDKAQLDQRADRVELAGQHLRGIEERVSRVRISTHEPPALVVTIDGAPTPRERWARGVPLDPGAHVVRATADLRAPWQTSIHVGSSGDVVSLEIPRLAEPASPSPRSSPLSSSPSPLATSPATASSSGTRRTLGWLVGGLGVVSLGLGGYFGVRALGTQSDADPYCHDGACSRPGVELVDDARGQALVADIAMGVGLVAVVASGILLLGGRDHDAAPSLRGAPLDRRTGASTVGLAW